MMCAQRMFDCVLKTFILLTLICATHSARAQSSVPAIEAETEQRVGILVEQTLSKEERKAARRIVRANNKACQDGDAEACLAAGDAYQNGTGVGVVGDIAAILYGEACDAALPAGCSALGRFHAGAGGTPSDMVKAGKYYEMACDLGDLDACQRFASLLRSDLLGPPDYARSNAIIEQACEAGSGEVCIYLADLVLANEQWSDNHDKAMDLLDAECGKASIEACERLIAVLQKQTQRDEWLIGKYQHNACYLGRASACHDMGNRVHQGKGFTPDRNLALSYFDKACALGTAYCDVSQALRATPDLRAGCDARNVEACADLGRALSVESSPKSILRRQLPCSNGAASTVQ